MNFDNLIRKFFDAGMGNIEYDTPSRVGANGAPIANNGLSESTVTAGTIVLGQNFFQAGNPANLLSNRHIPLNTHTIFIIDTVNDGISISGGRIGITGDLTGNLFLSNLNGVNSNQLDLTVTSAGVAFDFGGVSNGILSWVFATKHLFYTGAIDVRAINLATRTVAAAVVTFGDSDTTILADTSGGNINVNVDPTTLFAGRMGWVKKLGVDLNTVTITPTSGSIFGGAGAQASFTFSGAGESIQFQSDGTNLYVL